MLREVGDLPMVTQLLSGTASGMRGQQLNTDSEKLSGNWNLIEMELVGCLPAFGLIMATDQLVGLGRGLGREMTFLFSPGYQSKVLTALSPCPPWRTSSERVCRAHFWHPEEGQTVNRGHTPSLAMPENQALADMLMENRDFLFTSLPSG